jgi:hypothetical protein
MLPIAAIVANSSRVVKFYSSSKAFGQWPLPPHVLARRTRHVTLWAGRRWLGLIAIRSGRRERQGRGVIKHLTLLRRELVEASRLQLALARLRWHCTQRLNRILDRLTSFRRETVVLRGEVSELLPLLGLQVLPHLSAAQHLLLTVRRQAVEVLQALLKALLSIGRQLLEVRITLQCAPLLINGLVAVLVEPLSKMMSLARRPISIVFAWSRRGLELRLWRGPGLRTW